MVAWEMSLWSPQCGGTVDELVVKDVWATLVFFLFNIIISITIWWCQCGGMVDVYVAVLDDGGGGQ